MIHIQETLLLISFTLSLLYISPTNVTDQLYPNWSSAMKRPSVHILKPFNYVIQY
jgi:hypothetical protein